MYTEYPRKKAATHYQYKRERNVELVTLHGKNFPIFGIEFASQPSFDKKKRTIKSIEHGRCYQQHAYRFHLAVKSNHRIPTFDNQLLRIAHVSQDDTLKRQG